MKWLENYQKVKQLRDALVWLPVWERDKRAFVPEVRERICFPYASLSAFSECFKIRSTMADKVSILCTDTDKQMMRADVVVVTIYASRDPSVFPVLSWQNLKHLVKAVTLENLISHRSLLFEGRLVLTGLYGSMYARVSVDMQYVNVHLEMLVCMYVCISFFFNQLSVLKTLAQYWMCVFRCMFVF